MLSSPVGRLMVQKTVYKMSSKKYRGKTCAYCAVPNSSTTADHVIARGFFLENQRGNLPQVPACALCNGEKSELEHYLMTVLPFGGRHLDASANLAEQVPRRLAKNSALADELRRALRSRLRLRSVNGEPWIQETILPLNPDKLIALYRWIAIGLSYEHWNLSLPLADFVISAAYLMPNMAAMFDAVFDQAGQIAVHGNLGDGTFIYAGFQGKGFSLWRMSIYGVEVSGDPRSQPPVSNCYVFSAPRGTNTAIYLAKMFGEHKKFDRAS